MMKRLYKLGAGVLGIALFGVASVALAFPSSYINLPAAQYSGKSLDVSAQASSQPIGMFLRADGLKLYVDDRVNKITYQYSLSTAWDISTATYDTKSFNHSAQSNDTRSVIFNADGTKYYLADNTGAVTYQYSLSVAWDVSTATYDTKTCAYPSGDAHAEQIWFNSDGTKFFEIGSGQANKKVYRYSLSTAYDVSTCAFDTGQTFTLDTQSTSDTGFALTTDGLRAIYSAETQVAYSYTLTTALDLTTMTYDSKSFADAAQVTDPRNMAISADNGSFYIDDSTSKKIWQFGFNYNAAVYVGKAGVSLGKGALYIK